MKLSVFISGQKKFGEEVLRLCLKKGIKVVGVCCPLDDKYIGTLAKVNDIKIIAAGTLSADTMPDGIELPTPLIISAKRRVIGRSMGGLDTTLHCCRDIEGDRLLSGP